MGFILPLLLSGVGKDTYVVFYLFVSASSLCGMLYRILETKTSIASDLIGQVMVVILALMR